MIVRIDSIPDTGLKFDETQPVEWLTNFPDLIEGKGVSAAGKVAFGLDVNRIGDQIHITGEIKVPVRAECSRCLEDVLTDVVAPVDVILVPAQGSRESEDVEDEGFGTYAGGEIDLAEHLRGQLALYFPWQFLCNGDCKGLCPRCGCNLNNEICRCKNEITDPRWTVIDKLKI